MKPYSRKKLDLTGQRFGKLTVIGPAENIGDRTAWTCLCECGATTVVRTGHLRSGHVTSCGECAATGVKSLTYVDGTCVEMIRAKTIRRNNTSGVPGVDWRSSKGTWRASICFKGKRYYPEYFNYMNLVYFKEIQQAEDGSYILGIRLFAKDYDSETMTACRRQAFSDAQETLRSLYDAGELLPGMSERERALVITQWVVAHAEYDNDETRLCHTAWSVFRRGTAVCDGYVSALQLLLSLDGIRCRGQLGTVRGNETLHLWTIAVLDGVEVGIDPMGCEIDFRYFGMDWPKMEKWYVFRGEAA